MATKPETVFKKRIRPLLDKMPRSWWIKTQMLALCGIPDFLGCVNGHFIALELKVEGKDNDPSKLQFWVLQKIIAAGGIGIVVKPENWIATYKLLNEIARGEFVFKPEPPPSLDDLN